MTKKWTPKPKDTGTFSIWLMLPTGAYAVARRWAGSYDPATDPRDIMVRSRKRKYLDRLRAQFLPELGPDEGKAGQGTDYGHRSFCRSEDLARAMARMALAIDASGFKDHCQDNDLHTAYHRVWNALVTLDDNSPFNPKPRQAPAWQRQPRPEDCQRFGEHYWDREGSATCKDCGARRTKLRNGGYRYNHQARHAVRLCGTWGEPLSAPRAA